MKKKDIVETKIIESLEASNEKPNPHILDEAKNELNLRKTQRKRIVYRYALATCAVIVVCLAIVLPLMILNTRNGLKELEYTSMQKYFDENNIRISTFEEFVFEYSTPCDSPIVIEDDKYKPYVKEKCVIVQKEKTSLYLEEIYNYINKERVAVYILLDDNDDVKREYFSDYLDYDRVYKVFNIYPFYYSFDEENQEGKAYTEYNGCVLYFSIQCESEKNFFNHFQNFMVFQKA